MKDRLGDRTRLQHILEAIEEIENYTKSADIDTFAANSMMFHATLRQLEIIGEASNRLSEQIISNNKLVPWNKIVGLRNMIAHEYFGIDDITIWNVIKINLPDFKKAIKQIVDEIE